MKFVNSILLLLFIYSVLSIDISHVYLSPTGNHSEIQLTFTTQSPPDYFQIVYWDVSDGSKNFIFISPDEDTELFITPFKIKEYITSVTLTNLQPATKYQYVIYNPPAETLAYNFTSLPALNSPVSVLMYSDLTSGALNQWASQHSMDFIVHFGESAYNGAEEISALYPSMSLTGLDDLSYHSYDIGDYVHFIGINTEVYYGNPAHLVDQWFWLKKDLEMVRERKIQPWIVVYGHRQMYDTFLMRLGLQCTDGSLLSCNLTQPCFSDMYIAKGNLKTYERMFSDNDIIRGPGDQQEDKIKDKLEDNTNKPNAIISSVSLLTVYNYSFMLFQQVQLNNEILDEFWIVKDEVYNPNTLNHSLSAT